MKKTIFYIGIMICFSYNIYAANISLQIMNIKAAGTGSPTLPSTNRIFKAYPGIEYNIRAAVRGGVYPYTYSLSNAPDGMTINSRTGKIVWTNPQSNASNIIITVVDSESTSVQATWSITVTTDNFWFVNSSYEGTSTGSITQPYKTIMDMLNANKPLTDMVYFRTGTYTLAKFGPDNGRVFLNPDYGIAPQTWIGYPGESVVIDHDSFTIVPTYFWADNIHFTNMLNYGWQLAYTPQQSYKTWYRCKFTNFTSNDTENNNQGIISSMRDGVNYNAVFQECEFDGWTGGDAIGSLYQYYNILAENNYFHNGGTAGGGIYFAVPVSVKEECPGWTIRGNKMVIPSGAYRMELYNNLGKPDNGEFLYNYVYRLSNDTAVDFYGIQTSWAYRNTHVGDVVYEDSNNSSSGNYFDYNVTLGTAGGSGVTLSNNTTVTYGTSGVIDTDGKLQGDYATYVGSRGWQLSDGYTPIELLDLTESGATARTAAGATFSGAEFH